MHLTEFEEVRPDVHVLKILEASYELVTTIRCRIIIELQEFLQTKHTIIILVILLDHLRYFRVGGDALGLGRLADKAGD